MLQCPSFFFSSRRRHTRFDCDWSSDVCSSDLTATPDPVAERIRPRPEDASGSFIDHDLSLGLRHVGLCKLATEKYGDTERAEVSGADDTIRSEERRVGKECRSRRAP